MDVFCNDCPRQCGAKRGPIEPGGVCRSPALPRVSRAAPHFGEEPCISGVRGSGTVFFTGCNLRCVFCQNREISRGGGTGEILSVPALRDLMLRLRDQGVHNINLVTGAHFIRPIAEALQGLDLGIPVVWNSSGYESVDSLRLLEGLVQVYLPDFKYWKPALAKRYSLAEDYPAVAAAAIREMFRQTGPCVLDEDGMLRRGVLIRHLILPGQDLNAMDVIDFAAEEFPAGSVLFSLMSQYTPMPGLENFPELQQRVDAETNLRLIAYLQKRGLEGYWQEPEAATDEMIPAFDGTGL
ncbi:MAG: radical SAM protein [Oscillospiraceae bacterium]|nr:radical SAM protein [Oscillospiraceae bacterium]